VPLGLLLVALVWLSDARAAAPWSTQRSPAPGAAQAIGAYAGGCLQGAAALPPSGPGYEALHLARHRTFGHPALVAYVTRLAAAAKKQRLGPLVVGDLAQARGGPTPSGHRSHQSGLDVDIGYAAPAGLRPGHVKPRERERLAPPAVVDLGTQAMTARWGQRVARLLAVAAADPAVDRLFVNPAIKRALCAGPARGAPWLSRVRPWWGHHDHFHVRLRCPDDSPLCQPQEPLPTAAGDGDGDGDRDGDGCGASLAWWFSADAQATRARRAQAEETAPGPALPAACAPLLTGGP
jgi:penicillin-insensitive murein endopeptidase